MLLGCCWFFLIISESVIVNNYEQMVISKGNRPFETLDTYFSAKMSSNGFSALMKRFYIEKNLIAREISANSCKSNHLMIWQFQTGCCEQKRILQFSPWASFSIMLGNRFLMLHFLKLFFILLRFLLKFKALIKNFRPRAELENRDERFHVIIGDLTDPMEGGPCYQLYTKSFYELYVV